MKRTVWLLVVLLSAGMLTLSLIQSSSSAASASAAPRASENNDAAVSNPLTPPAHGQIPVAFLISEGAVVIDFTGPWEVFQDVHLPKGDMPFRLYTVAPTLKPIHASGGMKIIPDYSIATAPMPKVLVIPAQSNLGPATKEWIRKVAKNADVTMSVCTGAFALASTGLLSGKAATTHHSAYTALADQYPDIQVKRGARFVEAGNLASAGGLSSGIDLALTRGGALLRARSRPSDRFCHGISGRGMDEPRLKLDLRPTLRPSRGTSGLSRVRHGSRSGDGSQVGLQRQDLLLHDRAAQTAVRRQPADLYR